MKSIGCFRQYPEAIENALSIADACTFSLDKLKYIEPEEKSWTGRRRRNG